MTEQQGIRDEIDEARVARLFSGRRVNDADPFIEREVARRMIERLQTVRIDAARVLDLGCGTGGSAEMLTGRFPAATLAGIDIALPRLQAWRGRAPRTGVVARWLRRELGALAVQGDFATLPFDARSFDVLWSNLALHWSAAPHRVLAEWSRVARIGGLVAFSTFGPDTLREVRAAFDAASGNASSNAPGEARHEAPGRAHVMSFVDMHDYGDMLIASGFVTPVVDMERLTLTYTTAESFWSDVRALGGNALVDRPRSLQGRHFGRRLRQALDGTRDANGRYALTLELVFAHAWKGEPRTTRAGEAIVRVERRPSA